MIELSEPTREEAEHPRELAKLMQTPSETEKMYAELAFLRAKHCSRRSKPTRELPEPTREPLKQRFLLPEHLSKLPEHRSRQTHALHNASRAAESFYRVRQGEGELLAKPPKPVSRQPEPRLMKSKHR